MHDILKDLNWRYATKKFDSTKIISPENLDIIKESLRLVPTSYGLQPLKFIIVDSKEIREQLKPISYNQTQVVDASHLIIICCFQNTTDAHIDDFVSNISSTRKVEIESIQGYSDYMKSTINGMNQQDIMHWNKNQAYIALGQLLHTCASLKIDATPMEGFNPQEYDKLLNLTEKNLHASLVVPIGYRHEEDSAQHQQKVRKSQNDLFITI